MRYINHFPAGGATDIMFRIVCQSLSELSGQHRLEGRDTTNRP